MAYNSSKGPQQQGDLKFESDPDDTQIDFENDFIALKTDGSQRFIVSGSFITSSIPISCSSGVTAGSFATATSAINANHISSSLNISGSKIYADGVLLTPGVVSAVANGVDNRVATFSSADALNGEANLTFDGTDLGVSDKIFHIGDTDTYINFTTDDINFHAGGVNFLDLTEDTQNEATFNEGGVDIDFRVESENDTHMLFVDAANDAVSIGVSTDAPSAVLEVVGDGAAGKATLTVIHAENTNNAANIVADSITTAKALRISADALTTGNALWIDDDSSSTGTRNTAIVIQNHTGAINATALAVQSDGGVTGVNLDKNYSDLTEASIVGLNIDFDKTGASTSDNNMYGIQLDMDNTTATNGNNYMYGLHVTPTLTHAADAGGSFVYGAHISAQGGTNGSSLVQGARIEAAGGDFNYGIQLDVEDGPNNVDLRIESSADSGDYFQIQTTTNGATTITTNDDNATAAHLTCSVDGNILLNAVGSNVIVSGNLAIQTATPTIHFSSSAGSDLAQIGINDSNNILIQNNTINKHVVFKTNDAGTMKEGLRIDGAVPEVVVNQGSDSLIDFRVESNSNTHMLMVDGSGDKVGINVSVPTHTLTVAGDASVSGEISGSGGVHITGSSPLLAIGDKGGTGANDGMLFIRPSDTSNRVLCLMQSKADDGNRIIFGVTGSGQVLCGGAHFGGVLNISGSKDEKLISAKSDTLDPAFYVSGSGEMFVGQSAYLSGSVRHGYTVKTTSADTYISGTTDRVAIFVLGSPHNAYLPELSDALNGITITVKSGGSAAVTVTGSTNTAQFIDGSANKVLEQGDAITLLGYNGAAGYEWAILNHYDAS
jgi:hypothetical protein